MLDVHSTSTFAAERYVLGELPADERDEFEAHFFSCTECADRVLAASTFVENAKAVLPELDRSPVPVPKASPNRARNWFDWSWAPQAALASIVVLAAVAGYQNAFQIPHLRASAASNELTLSGAPVLSARRAASGLVFSAGKPTVSVIVTNEWEESFPRYASEILKEADTAPVLTASPVAASGSLILSLPAARLGVGKYTMMLYGVSENGARQIVGRYPFAIQD